MSDSSSLSNSSLDSEDKQIEEEEEEEDFPVASNYEKKVVLICDEGGASRKPLESDAWDNCHSPSNGLAIERESPCVGSAAEQEQTACLLLEEKYSQASQRIFALEKEINRLESENQRLVTEHSHQRYEVQIDTLAKSQSQLQKELERLKEYNQIQTQISANNYASMRTTLEAKLEKLGKQYEGANKEKEAMVMRYAVSEREVINQKKFKESLENKLKETTKEKELLQSKVKIMNSEKMKLNETAEMKSNELNLIKKENDKLREDVNSKDIKIKWIQNKLKTELEMHKETQQRLDKLSQKLNENREECEQLRLDCQAMIKAFQNSEENRAYLLDEQLKEQTAKLIMEQHEKEDKAEMCRALHLEMDNLKKKHQIIIEENNSLSVKVQSLERERFDLEKNSGDLKRSVDLLQQQVRDLQSQSAELISTQRQLQLLEGQLESRQSDLERVRQVNSDLEREIAASRVKEAELLDFTQKLTEKNVRLQSEFSANETKLQELDTQRRRLQELKATLELKNNQLEQEKKQRSEETVLMARQVAERQHRADQITQQLQDREADIQVLKRKHNATIKELQRELTSARKQLETAQHPLLVANSSSTSRASSNTSLDGDSDRQQTPPPSAVLAIQGSEVFDQQTLIERIVKLQKANARKSEKIEFLEEHTKQLLSEVQRKTRLVQSLALREPPGALVSNAMDANKLTLLRNSRKAKAELAKHGGIMAAIYGGKTQDPAITLELSLEINKKLQAVLEDTLLKNITLKENIDTLGEEIARLTKSKS